jgi:hypothetical protein
MELPADTKIGTKLTNVTLKKVILIVLLLMMSTPMLAASYWMISPPSLQFDTEQWGSVVQRVADSSATSQDFNEATAFFLRETYDEMTMPILNMTAKYLNEPENKYIYIWTAAPDAYAGLRNTEKTVGYGSWEADALDGTRQVETYIQINIRESLVFASWLGICKTLTVCI